MKHLEEMFINENIDAVTVAEGVIAGLALWSIISGAIELGAAFTLKGLVAGAKKMLAHKTKQEETKYLDTQISWAAIADIADKIDISKCPTCRRFPSWIESGSGHGVLEPSNGTKKQMAKELLDCLTDEEDIKKLKNIFNI